MLSAHYALEALPPQAVITGHGAAAQDAIAANKAALSAGLNSLGHHLGLSMDDSWEKGLERDVRRAFNNAAVFAVHALKPLRSPFPPFGSPLPFPLSAGAFRAMRLEDARYLSSFYALPLREGADELMNRRSDIASHIGFCE